MDGWKVMSDSILSIALSTAVPLHILELERNGGPTPEDAAGMPTIAQELAEHGDLLLFKSRKPGETARLFNREARGIALLAFAPGGVTIFGRHYEARIRQ